MEGTPTLPASISRVVRAGAALTVLILAACGGSGPNTYTVGGTTYGLAGSAFQLSDNDTDTLSINKNGHFVFSKLLVSSSAYNVTITAQPTDQTLHCTVSNGIGTIGGANIVNLVVRCAKVGRFVYITEALRYNIPPPPNIPLGGVLAYTIDETTGIQTVPGSPFATDKCPCTLSVTPDGRFAYIGSAGTLYPYLIDSSTGALSAGGAGTKAGSGSIGIDPESKFVYAFDPTINTVSAFAIDPTTGSLTPVTDIPWPTGTNPGGAAFNPSGQFLYVANSGSNNISAFAINRATGALTEVAGSPFAASGNPNVVTVDPSGGFLYTLNAISYSSVLESSYTIDASTGALTPIADAPLNASPALPSDSTFFFDPNSNRAYATGPTIGQPLDLWSFAIDEQSGHFIQGAVTQSLFILGNFEGIVSTQIDPSGKFECARIYKGSTEDYSTFSCVAIDPTTGAQSSGGYKYGVYSDFGNIGLYTEVWGTITIAT